MESSAQSAVTVRLEDYEDSFLAGPARLGYASRSREAQRGLVRHLSRWLAMRGLALSELSEEVAGQYAAARRQERSHLRSERALAGAGIPGPGAAHRLRHTAACGVLAAGGGLAEAGQLLRQASPQATAVYARSDIAALRSIARPWPGTAR